MKHKIRILVVNDDGYFAKGIHALAEALSGVFEKAMAEAMADELESVGSRVPRDRPKEDNDDEAE